MARLYRSLSRGYSCKWYRWLLALAGLSGYVCGILFFFSVENAGVSMVRGMLVAPVSIVGLLNIFVLPFLLSAFAVFLSATQWLYLICFVKAAQFSWISLSILAAFGSAGWLLHAMLMFSDILSTPLLYLYWLHCLPGEHRYSFPKTILLFGMGVLFTGLELTIISPFLISVINL